MSEETLQMAKKRREVKSKGERERYTHLNAEFQRIARRYKKAPLIYINSGTATVISIVQWSFFL